MDRSRRQALASLAAAAAAFGVPVITRAQARKVRFGHQHPADSPIHQGLVKAVEVAAAKTGGRVQIDLFPSSQLGSAREMMTQVIDANLDFIIEGPGALATLQRPLSIFEAPFLARDFDHLRKMLATDWAKGQFAQLAQNRNMVNVGVWYYGVRHFTTKPRALKTAADAKALKIRVPEAPLFLDMIRALGAAPTPMTLSEVYLALQTGVVDGQENPLPTINNNKFFEVQKYLNLTSHIIVPQLIMVSAKYWSTLSDADKAGVVEAFAEGGKINDGLTREAEGRLLGEFKAKGMEIVQPDLASFRQAMTSVYPKYESDWGKGTFEKMQKL
jgi:tripartite ATP-independent transporter DctP family solute receptor